ncbi:type IV pilus assembly protein PilW [Desulfonatronum zhilinae]|nr:type IV pilus assembly protein PilW [Desulfonatronum zhilinae]
MYHFEKRSHGLTLVELLVAMVIGLVVLGGVYQIFRESTATYRMQEGLSRLQENGRFALDFLVYDVRQAGYRGCITHGPMTNTLNNADSWTYNFNVGIQGYDNVGTSVSELGNLSTLSGSDVIVIRTLLGDPVRIVKNNNSAQLFVEVTSNEPDACPGNKPQVSGLCEGDILMVSDCVKSRVFQAGNIQVASGELNVTHPASGTPGNAISSWGGANAPAEERFGPDAEIVKISTIVYHVRDNFSLYRKVGAAAAEPLVDGVQTMQVLYGIDTDGDRNINQYVTADSVGDWESVRSVQIGLLMRTTDEIRDMEADDAVYNVLGTDFGPYNDRHLRRVFTATVGLRNRLR